jgi:hypothetical protein
MNSYLPCAVWFTVSVCVYDAKEEPTALGIAAKLTAITAGAVLAAPFLMLGGALLGAIGGSVLAGTSGVVGGAAAVSAVTGATLAVASPGLAVVALAGIKSVLPVKKDGVYSNATILHVRGNLSAPEDGLYKLRFVSEDEERAEAYLKADEAKSAAVASTVPPEGQAPRL